MMGFFSSLLELLGRVLLGFLFIINGIEKIFNYNETIQYMSNYNVNEYLLIPAIIIEILFSILIIIGYKTRISAFILALFTIMLAIIFHSDFTNQMQTISFLKNLAISGGLFLLVTKESGRFSLDK